MICTTRRALEAIFMSWVIMITHDMKIASNARRVVHIIDGELSDGDIPGDSPRGGERN